MFLQRICQYIRLPDIECGPSLHCDTYLVAVWYDVCFLFALSLPWQDTLGLYYYIDFKALASIGTVTKLVVEIFHLL